MSSTARYTSSRPGLAIVLAAAAVFFPDTVPSGADTIDTAQVERGRYVARLGDCVACHTADDGAPYAGGRAIKTPFGIVYSANITTDAETGIGAWTNDDFWNLMHSGIRKDGAYIYPAMPYPWFTKMTRQDVDDLKTYLDTLPPVRNSPPENQLLPPLQFRQTVAAWNFLFFEEGVFKPDPSKSAEWNRGAYIVEGPGHCGACHTPADLLGGPERDRRYEGRSIQNWWAPDLTSGGADGVATWSEEEILSYLKDGRNQHTVASGPMADVIENSTQYITDADLNAIATYLKDLPIEERARDASRLGEASKKTMTDGEHLFRDNCAACHGIDGAGVPRLIADLRKSGVVNAPDPVGVLRAILAGANGNVTHGAPTRPGMPPFDWKFDDREIAAVATYLRQSFGNRATSVSAGDVADLRKTLAQQ